jgi:hypothetical protein
VAEPDTTNLKWESIGDFSPGCYTSGGAKVGNTVDRMLPAPRGAADGLQTFNCFALPSGGLAALPAQTATYNFPGPLNPTGGGYTFVVGLLVHDELNDGTTEAIVIGEYDTGSGVTGHNWQAGSFIVESSVYNLIVATARPTAAGIFGSPYPAMTRSSNTNLPVSTNPAPLPPYFPVVVFPSGGPAQPSASGALYMYPDPNTPTTFAPPLNLVPTAPSVAGQLVMHQSRIICLAGQNYSYPAGGGFSTNENLNYTDPPLYRNNFLNQNLVLAAEAPYGYGAAGSVSAGELFIVKKRAGATIVTGDLNTPSVTQLPGVQPTGNFYGKAESTPAGLIYCSYNNGAWSWNGSNTSDKISQNLDDNFFLPPEFPPGTAGDNINSNNYGFYVNSFGDMIYFSNNWLFDMVKGAWWTYYPRKAQGGADLFWVQPVNGKFIYCAQLSIPNPSQVFMYRFDPQIAAQTYQWQSLPIRLAPQDQVCDLRRVIVRASCSQGTGQVTITVLDDNVVVAGPFGPINVENGGPQLLRFNIGAVGVTQPAIRINVANNPISTADMPVIHNIDFGYTTRAHLPSQN